MKGPGLSAWSSAEGTGTDASVSVVHFDEDDDFSLYFSGLQCSCLRTTVLKT